MLFRNVLVSAAVVMLLSGCAQNTKIVVPSYTAPADIQKIEELKSGGETVEGAYLTFAINPDLSFAGKKPAKAEVDLLMRNLATQVRAQITETGFITLHPIYDMASVVLDMEVLDYQYVETSKERKASMKITFTLSKGTTPVISKIYDASDFRFSADPNRLPSKQEVVSRASQMVVKKFVSDISPTRTNQMREFLPLPSALSHVLSFAEKGNFESAIEDMLKFEGKKEMSYFYDLAILYEALGSRTENLKTTAKAKDAYEEAFRLGGNKNQLVTAAKSRFDNFYRLLVLTQSQQQKNQQLNQEINQQFMVQ